jgi:hypothetical protein
MLQAGKGRTCNAGRSTLELFEVQGSIWFRRDSATLAKITALLTLLKSTTLNSYIRFCTKRLRHWEALGTDGLQFVTSHSKGPSFLHFPHWPAENAGHFALSTFEGESLIHFASLNTISLEISEFIRRN